MSFYFDEEYCLQVLRDLLASDSTTGFYEEIETLICGILDDMGYPYQKLRKGGIIANLGGEGNAVAVTAHLDTIGLMVRRINADGTLNVCPVGGLYPFYCVMENVNVYSRDGRKFTGTICRTPNSIHVTENELRDTPGDFRSNVCVVLDEDVRNASDTRKLGIETGGVVALEPRLVVSNGYIKSHFIDAKACVATLLCVMREMKRQNTEPGRKVYAYFSVYEEIGHGTSWLPADVKDILAVDIAPVGPDQTSDERKVSIFAKDSRYPYHYGMTNEIRSTAIRAAVDYCMDVFTPHYGTDCDTSLVAGYDVRHAAIGPGTANSHGYERTHIDGLRNTATLLWEYLH